MKEINDNTYEDLIKNTKKLVIKFEADWCGPCRNIAPIFDQLESENKGIEFVKCNVDDSPKTSAFFGIRNIPTILFIQDGNVVDKQVGAVSKSMYQEKINNLL